MHPQRALGGSRHGCDDVGLEIKEDCPPNSIVDFYGLAQRCLGGGTDFQMCLTLAGRLADAHDSRWVGFPFAAPMDD